MAAEPFYPRIPQSSGFGAPLYQVPPRRPVSFGARLASFVYSLAWFCVGVTAVLALFFCLYRNDVLLQLARGLGVESRYLAFERSLLGSPGWGTPRSLAPLPDNPPASNPPASVASTAPASAVADPTPAAPVREPRALAPASAAAPAPAAAPASGASAEPVAAKRTAAPAAESAPPQKTTAEGVKVVSLDALALVPTNGGAAPRSRPATRPTVERARAVSPAAPRETLRAAKEDSAPSKSQPVEKAAPAPKPAAPAPKPAAPKSLPRPADDNPLKAAIRSAIAKDDGKAH